MKGPLLRNQCDGSAAGAPACWRRPGTFVAMACTLAAISSFVVADQFFRGESAYSLVAKAPLPKGVCVATAAN